MDQPQSRIDVQRYRCNQICKRLTKLNNFIDYYNTKIKKYKRRIVVIDVVVYSVSAVIAGTGLLLSTLTMTAPTVITIIVSASTTIAGVLGIIAKKIDTCTNAKLHDYMIKLHTVAEACSKLSLYVSSCVSDGEISDTEFAMMMKTYDDAFKVIANDFNELNNNNNNNDRQGVTSADRY